MRKIALGCIADDFTGASDVASFLSNEGVKTLLINGIAQPENIDFKEFEAIVIALKTRTMEKEKAVNETLNCVDFLDDLGVEQIYIKYCSTFDSTKDGNIGPVVDSVLEKVGQKYTILCPALPENGRTVKNGYLYVNGIPLNESHMKDHPLTPMWESDITKLMKPQSKYNSYVLSEELLMKDNKLLIERLNNWCDSDERFYIVPEFIEDIHGEKIIELFGDLKILTGGSGLMKALGKKIIKEREKTYIDNEKENINVDKTEGKGIILAGSCSVATLAQIEEFNKIKETVSYKIDSLKVIKNEGILEDIKKFIDEHNNKKILIYSSNTKNNIEKTQSLGKFEVADKLERLMGDISVYAISKGYRRIIVAGGETSGAVAKKLEFDAYIVGSSISPGVPILMPIRNKQVRLVYKSGNFGDKDFFSRALDMTRKDN